MALYDDSYSNNNGSRQEAAGLDRLSDLPDDILVLVLESLTGGDDEDVRPLARTCVLSKRWRSLPAMVSKLKLTVQSFLPPEGSSIPVRCLHEATAKFTDALRFFLATPGGGQRDMMQRRRRLRLTLRFYLTKHHHRLLEMGRLLSSAVARGEVQDLAVDVDTRTVEDASYRRCPRAIRLGIAGLCFARRFMRLFRAAAPGGAVVGSALKQLALRNLCFLRASDLESVLRACEALETLHLDGCWFLASRSTTLTIDAPPSSRLRNLKLTRCGMAGVHVVRLPRLLRLGIEGWSAQACPVTFGPASAPSLKCVTLLNRSAPGQMSFKLSDLGLDFANPVECLRLDFDTDRVWVQPENRRNLRAAFSNLKELHVWNIFANAGISWTMFLIKAAPLLELINIHVCHECICSGAGNDDDRQDLEWEDDAESDDHFEHLRTVKIRGATDDDDSTRFLRLVLERAANMELLLLRNDRVRCTDCIRIAAQQEEDPSTVLSTFPEDKDGIDAFVARLKDGIPTSARILVHTPSNKQFEY